MSGSWRVGEEKERPGVYRRHVNAGGSEIAGTAENVGLAVVSGTWGPLNKPVVTDASDDIASIIGSGKGANVITQMRIGGANTIMVVRVGSGGTPACRWEKVNIDCESETLKELALYLGEPEAYCYIDSTEGEYLPGCGGSWDSTSGAGGFSVSLFNPRTLAYGNLGFRSAYFRKRRTE